MPSTDENAPGVGGTSPLEVERQTLAKVRNWFGEVSDQIERDRREARRRVTWAVVLVFVIGCAASAFTAYTIGKRAGEATRNELEPKLNSTELAIARQSVLLDTTSGHVSGLLTDRDEMRKEIEASGKVVAGLVTNLAGLSKQSADQRNRFGKLEDNLSSLEKRNVPLSRLAELETAIRRLEQQAAEMELTIQNLKEKRSFVPEAPAPARTDRPPPPSNLRRELPAEKK